MEIKNLNNSKIIGAYKNVSGNPVRGGKLLASGAEKRTNDNFDKIEFDFGRSISAAKVDVSAEISAGASNALLETLRLNYEGDNLPVTPEQIAESIFG